VSKPQRTGFKDEPGWTEGRKNLQGKIFGKEETPSPKLRLGTSWRALKACAVRCKMRRLAASGKRKTRGVLPIAFPSSSRMLLQLSNRPSVKDTISKIIEDGQPELLTKLLILKFRESWCVVISQRLGNYGAQIMTPGQECNKVIAMAPSFGFATNGWVGQATRYNICKLIHTRDSQQFVSNLVGLLVSAELLADDDTVNHEFVTPTLVHQTMVTFHLKKMPDESADR
jgi:hypothetical protein